MLSMWPLINPTDQIVDLAGQSDYDIDDIIVFRQSKRLIAHRIIYKTKDAYITKGDNNRVSDHLVERSQILGKATSIRQNNKIIKIESIYALQAANYLKELKSFQKLSTKYHLEYIVLKGIPIYQKYTGAYPHHFIFDADVMIHPKDLSKLLKILGLLLFKIDITNKVANEFSAVKFVSGLPVSFDIHLEPAIAFSQFPSFNKLLPQIKILTEELWDTSIDHFLSPNHQFIYLLLHALHHSYAGSTRWNLIDKISRNSTIQPTKCVAIIQKLQIEDLVYGPLLFYHKYYGNNKKVAKIIGGISPSARAVKLSKLIVSLFKPWTHQSHFANRLELLIYLFILSPLKLSQKLKILFHSITSIDFKISRNWVKSKLA